MVVPEPWSLDGIIPACAGSTLVPVRHHASPQDHPRMRGEHPAVTFEPLAMVGSSPHARGALDSRQGLPLGHGIIPACAGSTVFYLQAYQKSHSTLFTFFA